MDASIAFSIQHYQFNRHMPNCCHRIVLLRNRNLVRNQSEDVSSVPWKRRKCIYLDDPYKTIFTLTQLVYYRTNIPSRSKPGSVYSPGLDLDTAVSVNISGPLGTVLSTEINNVSSAFHGFVYVFADQTLIGKRVCARFRCNIQPINRLNV